jgi:hypothetical protein
VNSHPEIIIVPFFFSTIGYIVWVLVTASQRKQRLRLVTEFHSKLLDKLGSVKDFGEFLQTDAGARFMKDLASEPAVTGATHERILRAAQLGAVFSCLGLGLVLLGFFVDVPGRGQEGLTTVGVVALSLGVGFAASAAAALRLARKLGLLSPAAAAATDMPAPSHI